VGVPVRPFKRISREEAALKLGLGNMRLKDGDFVIGIAGGSLSGAFLESLAEKLPGGTGDRKQRVFVALADAPKGRSARAGVRFVGRQWDMDPFYSLCDAVICRAGASTLAELAARGIPALAIPWEGAADGHQEANARCFAALTGNLWIGEKSLRESGPNGLEVGMEDLLRRCGDKNKNLPTGDACETLWRFARNFLPKAVQEQTPPP
jgi:UDP-N-acetylglucosamine--N-acetylmuramyl-(pentapeptide) pyrophosphoryl-undecaprenol N-acetylglucosamine transferase